jgi:hypothetical protein
MSGCLRGLTLKDCRFSLETTSLRRYRSLPLVLYINPDEVRSSDCAAFTYQSPAFTYHDNCS